MSTPGQRRGRSARPPSLVVLAAAVASASTASPPAEAAPDDRQVAIAGAGAIKIAVRGAGWIRVGQPALVAVGLDPNVDPANLRVYADGVEQAIVVAGNGDRSFTSDEAIELWGVGRDTAWTDARTYWLIADGPGARVEGSAPAPGGPAPANFTRTERLVERSIYLASVLNGDESNFFGAAVSTSPTVRTVTARHLDGGHAGDAVLRVTLQGVTASAHAIDVSLNGTLLGTSAFQNQEHRTFSFPASNLVEGDNQLTLAAHSGNDYAATLGIEVDYPHAYVADDDAFAFTAPAGTRVAVAGFSTPDVRVLDVTDPTDPVELTVAVDHQAGGYAVRVDVPPATGEHQLYAFTAARVGSAATVTADAPSAWGAPHEGELLILSHGVFLDALTPLVARRRQEGWSVQLVDVQDVYDEAGFGDKSPDAIRTFLKRARTTWPIPPRFVLLVGDATFDPRNFLGKGDFDFMPTRLVDTASMETASDDWFVDDELDGIPEIAIGRFPVRTAEQATAVVQKTLGYAGKSDLSRGGLFVTDTDGLDLDFTAASAAAETKVSDIMPVAGFQRGTSGTAADLVDRLDGGPFLVNYFGHGSVEVWDGLLTSAQAAALTNDHASIYVVMNCLNGFFHDLYTTSLAESLLTAPQGGAVAVWASSTLSEFAPQPTFNQELLMRLSRSSLGEAAIAAKSRVSDLDTRRTWLLFGDPTLFGAPSWVAPPRADGGNEGERDAGATTDAGGTSTRMGRPTAGMRSTRAQTPRSTWARPLTRARWG